MMRRIVFFALTAFCISELGAYDWPVEKKTILSVFGDLNGTDFHKGINIAGEKQPVHPIADGDVVFVYEEQDPFDDLPSGMGSFIVIEHKENLRSTYGHLEAGSVLKNGTLVTKSDSIGITGNTGATRDPALHLQVFDRELEQIINPFIPLPPLPEKKPPVIRAVSFFRDGRLSPLENGTELAPGNAELVAEIFDPRASSPTQQMLMPYSITVSMNGQQMFQVTFDSLVLRDGTFQVIPSTGVSGKSMYFSNDRVRIGDLKLVPGRTVLEITSMDFERNRSSASFSFQVRDLH